MDKVSILLFLASFVQILSNILSLLIFGRVIYSWFRMGSFAQRGRIGQFLYDTTDPVFNLAKKLPHRIGMIDLSPLIALVAIDLLSRLIIFGLTKML